MNEWSISGGCTISMNSGTSTPPGGTNRVVSSSAVRPLEYFGRRTDRAYPPVVATRIWTNQEPIASTTVLRKYRPTWTVDQASLRLLHAHPLRTNAIGWGSVC